MHSKRRYKICICLVILLRTRVFSKLQGLQDCCVLRDCRLRQKLSGEAAIVTSGKKTPPVTAVTNLTSISTDFELGR